MRYSQRSFPTVGILIGVFSVPAVGQWEDQGFASVQEMEGRWVVSRQTESREPLYSPEERPIQDRDALTLEISNHEMHVVAKGKPTNTARFYLGDILYPYSSVRRLY